MAKVTIKEAPPIETPSEQIVKAANFTDTITDPVGRALAVRRLNALDKLRMLEVVGPENSRNEAFLGIATVACHVTAIDGDPVAFPRTRGQLDALVQRLDDHGIAAVASALAERFGITESQDGTQAAKN